jgi:hypothetical protein
MYNRYSIIGNVEKLDMILPIIGAASGPIPLFLIIFKYHCRVLFFYPIQ